MLKKLCICENHFIISYDDSVLIRITALPQLHHFGINSYFKF